jgi:transcriptional regulator with XRE-family HTH domain
LFVDGDQPDSFGGWVARLRTEKGWSQGQLAELIGYDSSYVSRIESNQREPTADFAVAIAYAAEVDVREVLTAAGFRIHTDRALEGVLSNGKAALEIGRALAAIDDEEERSDAVVDILAIIRCRARRVAERARRAGDAGNRRPGRQTGDSPAGG